MGRGLFATEALHKGQTAFHETPFLSATDYSGSLDDTLFTDTRIALVVDEAPSRSWCMDFMRVAQCLAIIVDSTTEADGPHDRLLTPSFANR